ncbi:MAG: hypothetical protein QXS54_00440 [Candidatus Methanomethylicaceae archaeon]
MRLSEHNIKEITQRLRKMEEQAESHESPDEVLEAILELRALLKDCIDHIRSRRGKKRF